MRVYLDVSCLNRPFDDQSQKRVRLEAEAVIEVLERCLAGEWEHVSSTITIVEIDAIANPDQRARVRKLLPAPNAIMKLGNSELDRAAELELLGVKSADALHVAAAESCGATVLLSCDDRLCRAVRRNETIVQVPVRNPADWLKEVVDVPHDG
jgi:predicted nucleic acid-binding protein